MLSVSAEVAFVLFKIEVEKLVLKVFKQAVAKEIAAPTNNMNLLESQMLKPAGMQVGR